LGFCANAGAENVKATNNASIDRVLLIVPPEIFEISPGVGANTNSSAGMYHLLG
jgi:hypothetical protein